MEPPTRQLSRRNSLLGSSSGGDRRIPSSNNVSILSSLDESLPLPEHLAQKFSETQTSTLQRIFRYYDQDHSGRISVAELGAVLAKVDGKAPQPEVVTALMAEVDTNADDEIDFAEFCQAMALHNGGAFKSTVVRVERARRCSDFAGPQLSSFGGAMFDGKGYQKHAAVADELVPGFEYWVPDSVHVWRKVSCLSVLHDGQGGQVVVRDCEQVERIDTLPLPSLLPPSPANDKVVADLTSLHYLHEASVLANLHARWVPTHQPTPTPYTYMCNVLVAVNPLRKLPAVETAADYRAIPQVYTMPPHPFGVAETAYRQLTARHGSSVSGGASSGTANQAVVISGESGAGKTETFKLVLQHLLSEPNASNTVAASGSGGKGSASSPGGAMGRRVSVASASSMDVLQARLTQSNPLMEAFGNARTTRNHNSSRFGKFLKLVFVDTSGFVLDDHLPSTTAKKGGDGGKGSSSSSSELNLWEQRALQRAWARRPPAVWSLRGGQVDTYLLEKTRVVGQAPGEGGFHAFYALLAAAAFPGGSGGVVPPDPSTWRAGANGESHAYLPGYPEWLKQPESFEEPPRETYDTVSSALLALGVSSADVASIWRVLAGVLKLGDLSFEADTDQQHADGARISDGTEGQRCLRAAASLLGLSPPALLTLLTTRTIETGQQNAQGGGAGSPRQRRGTTLAVQLNPAAAALARDAMARLIYGHLFGWVVATVNQSLAPSRSNNATTKSTPGLSPTKEEPDGEEEHEKTDSKNTSQNQKELVPANAERRTLGLLDMFGFEAFLENDLEQLLINLANEALQDMYCQQVLLAESTLYCSEGLRVGTVEYASNADCVDLLVRGVVPLLDEQTVMAHGSDAAFVAQVHRTLNPKSPYLLLPHARLRHHCFTVRHYAEDVTYQCQGSFTVKNDNTVPRGLTLALLASTTPLIVDMTTQAEDRSNDASKPSASAKLGRQGPVEASSSLKLPAGRSKKARTVAGDFTLAMQSLVAALGASQCSYVRCVKPNSRMQPGLFENHYVATQLRSLGLLQTCEVLKVGLPHRTPYTEIRPQLEANLPPEVVHLLRHRPDKDLVAACLSVYEAPRSSYHLGYTRLFFHTGQYSELEKVFAAAARDDPQQALSKFRSYLTRLLFQRLLVRLQTGFAFIGILRRVREKHDRAFDLLKRNVHRKQTVKKWLALIQEESDRVAKEEREKAAASKLTLWLYRCLMANSEKFRAQRPNGQRPQQRKQPSEEGGKDGVASASTQHSGVNASALAAIVKAAEEAEALRLAQETEAKKLFEAELELHAEAFRAHAALLKDASVDQTAKMREEAVQRMTSKDVLARCHLVETSFATFTRTKLPSLLADRVKSHGASPELDHIMATVQCHQPLGTTSTSSSTASSPTRMSPNASRSRTAQAKARHNGSPTLLQKAQAALKQEEQEEAERLQRQQNAQEARPGGGSNGVSYHRHPSKNRAGPVFADLGASSTGHHRSALSGGRGFLAANGAPPPPLNAALVARFLPKPELMPTYRYQLLFKGSLASGGDGDETDGSHNGDAFDDENGIVVVGTGNALNRARYQGGGAMPSVLGSTSASAEGARAAVTQAELEKGRVVAALVMSAAALEALLRQLAAMKHDLYAAAAAHLIKQSNAAIQAPSSSDGAEHNATVQKCGRLLFDAEYIWSNMLDLQRWAQGKEKCSASRSFAGGGSITRHFSASNFGAKVAQSR